MGSNQIVNSTFTLNRSIGGLGGVGWHFYGEGEPIGAGPSGNGAGGALLNLGGLTLVNSTVWDNTAQGAWTTNVVILPGLPGLGLGDALVNSNQLNLVNTILGGPSSSNCVGQITDLGYNLCSDDTAGLSAPGSLNHTDPKLDPLADNGGPTPTLALLWGSPAIDAGSDVDCPLVDQRGRARPALAHCDIGAFEFVPEQLRIVTLSPGQTVRVAGVGPALQAFDLEGAADLNDFRTITSGVVDASCQFAVEVTSEGDWRFFRTRAR
jgi:hypothetical protein